MKSKSIHLSLLTIFFVFFCLNVFATHNRAGEITFVRLSGFTYKFTVITYSKASSQADRCELEVNWGVDLGNGKFDIDTLPRVNGPSSPSCPKSGELLGNDIKKNIYEGIYTFPGPDIYTVSVTDPNRVEGVINIPNSVGIPFYIETDVVINPFLGSNTSPQLLIPPIDNACYGKKFIHNPGAWDPDGDSLSYKLVSCKGEGGLDIPGYFVPAGVTLNPISGDLVWNFPEPAGDFNFAILIEEWRDGVLIGSVLRDMQVTVSGNCVNDPPEITGIKDTCVTAGDMVLMTVKANDKNFDPIKLTSYSGTYSLSPNAATFAQPASGTGSVQGNYQWTTDCKDVRVQPYSVSFKVEDSPPNGKNPLVDIKTILITVVAPAPKNLAATPLGNSITLAWQKSICTNAEGYKIYRKAGKSNFIPANCETGIPASTGYQLIGSVEDVNILSFTDNNNGNGLNPGVEYCYMIYAYFEDGAKSYASNEICAQLKKDVPIITHADVEETSATSGKVHVQWSKPVDVDMNNAPFTYYVYRSEASSNNFVVIDSLNDLNDTIYTDTKILNTTQHKYFYKIGIRGNTGPIAGFSSIASTVYLEAIPNDNRLELTWTFTVPWLNTKYDVYKRDTSGNFIFLTTVPGTSYTDYNLENGTEYCYYVEASGTYGGSGIVSPLINKSQQLCATPEDRTPPCAPTLSVVPDCEKMTNSLSWNNPDLTCSDDVAKYRIYYKATDDTSLKTEFIHEIAGATNTSWLYIADRSIAGCYQVTAVDLDGNESDKSPAVCVDNCPVYTLPNVFTPDGDGINDFFKPFPYKYVESVDLKIFNRWGQLVFETNDPDVLWDGRNMNKQMSSESVYYYVCTVNEIRLKGIVPREINGFVHLFSGTKTQAP